MNETNGEGNTEIPVVADLVIEEGDTAEVIKEKTDAWKAEVDKNNKQLYARTKKAEGYILVDGKYVKPTKPATQEEKPNETTQKPAEDRLSQADLITLVKADIAEEDIPDVLEYAKLKGISVGDALKTTVVKTILADKTEQRKISEGTNTGGGRRGSGKVSDTELLSNASKGILPESKEDMERLSILKRAG